MNRALLIAACFSLGTACLLAAAGAGISGNVYSNDYVGLTFTIPRGWSLATDAETREGFQESAKIMSLDSPAAQNVVGQMPGKVLLFLSERPFTSESEEPNNNMILIALNVREFKDEVPSSAAYLGFVAKGLKEKQPGATVSDLTTQSLGGSVFDRVNVRFQVENVTIHSSQLARMHNDYLVIMNLTAGDAAGLYELVQIADRSLRLADVSPAVDSSPEAVAFRKQSTLDTSGKSSSGTGNLLKGAGIVLLILGLFKIFGRKSAAS